MTDAGDMAKREAAYRPAFDDVLEALRAESYPLDKQGVDYAVGDLEIERSDGRRIPVRLALDHVATDDFSSADDVAGALAAALDTVRDDEVARDRDDSL